MENTKKIENTREGNTKLIALAITILLLLGAGTYLFIDNNNVKELNVQQKAQIDTLSTIKTQLELELASIKNELAIFQGKNIELDSMLIAANNEIEIKTKKIRVLINKGASVDRIKKEMEELRTLNVQYLDKIKELEARLLALTDTIGTLKTNNGELTQQVSTLQTENSELAKKVALAGALRVDNVLVIGEKKSKSGKYAPSKLKKANRFLVTFDLAENKLAESGERTIYVSITDPTGKVMQNNASGSFMNDDQNLSVPYTQMHTVSYGSQTQKIILPIDFDTNELKAGSYKIEFYVDKYLAGTKALALK